MAFKSISKKRRGRRVSITISMSDDEEQQKNKRKKKLHDRPSKTAKSKDFDYREESETEEESGQSEEESSNDDKGIEDDSEDKMYIKKIRTRNPPKSLANIMSKLTDAQIGTLKDMGFGTSVLEAGDVLYTQKCMSMVLKRSSTAVVTKWTARKLIMLQKEMIASNKKIIAPDTNIETHEIIAAETTLEKERMIKSKIIAAKNVVSQSPIKAVNFGDISGKASNGISNTPKDAQVTASGLRNKFTMLEVLMNGITCDLAKAIQQHPGDEEIEYIKLQWKEKILKRESEMNVKDKEIPCEQIFEVDRVDRGMEVEGEKNNHEMEVDLEKTDAHNTIDDVDRGMEVEWEKNNQEMEVDLEKTDAHKTIDADKQGASRLKDVNKSECTDWAKHSKISALTPKSLSSFVAHFDPVKVVSTMEEPLSVLLVNDIPSFDLGLMPTPTDVNVNADKQDVSNEESILDIVPLTFTRISAKLRLPQKKAKEQESTTIASATTASNTTKFKVVSNSVKDRSSVLLLNDTSSFDLGLTPTSPYVNLHTDTEPMLENEPVKKNEKELGPTNTISAFDVVPLSFAMPNATLVFFLVLLAKSHYYLLVFNLKTPKIEILDNSKNEINVSLDDRYGESFKKLKKLFIECLSYSEHQSWKSMKKAVCERIEMSWRTENNIIDCGIFMMRHMETYMGYAKNWKCGFKNEGWE
ncbi:ulp1 protease family, C-terminal catalytic domain-containing protein [Tanacetum coccineum]|uniref:Ulp1 protease family, C-terminal catalytic domain-containing protein n=1 Tax=Tanacetum coccineum TaxID=301880 RepID=A0ABQ5H731_9ASTR